MIKSVIISILLFIQLNLFSQVRLNSIGAELGIATMSATTSSVLALYSGLSIDFELTGKSEAGVRIKGLILQDKSLYLSNSNKSISYSSLLGVMIGYYSNQEIYKNLQIEGVTSIAMLKDNILEKSNNMGYGIALTAGLSYVIRSSNADSHSIKLGLYEDYTTTFTSTKPEFSSTNFRIEYQF